MFRLLNGNVDVDVIEVHFQVVAFLLFQRHDIKMVLTFLKITSPRIGRVRQLALHAQRLHEAVAGKLLSFMIIKIDKSRGCVFYVGNGASQAVLRTIKANKLKLFIVEVLLP